MNADVLLIDDETEFVNSIKISFSELNIPLDTAFTWDEGVRKFQVGLHELVIADYNLPNSLNGLKLLARIKPLRPSSRLILISGLIRNVPEEAILIKGLIDRYLPKTPDISSLLVEEAKDAVKRAACPTNWQIVAAAHILGSEIEESKIDEKDQLLQNNIKSD